MENFYDRYRHILNKIYNLNLIQGNTVPKMLKEFLEILNEFNKVNTASLIFLEWLKEKGLEDKLNKIINNLEQQGYFEKIINVNKIDKLEVEIKKLLSDLRDEILENKKSTSRQKVKYKTASISLDNTTSIDTYKKYIDKCKEMGLDVTLVVLTNLNSATDSIFTRINATRIQDIINYANSVNVKIVMLKPHIALSWGDDFNRPAYNPADKDKFFNNWGMELDFYADICNKNNIDLLSVTCEQQLQTDADKYQYWLNILPNLKIKYPNIRLTASMTTAELYNLVTYYIPQHKDNIVNLLDVFGINSYLTWSKLDYNSTTKNITQDDINEAWFYSADADIHMQHLNLIRSYYNIPVFITEVGCMPKVDGLKTIIASGAPNYDVQQLLFKSLLDVASNSDFIEGFAIWNMQDPFKFWTDGAITPGEKIITEYCKGGII